ELDGARGGLVGDATGRVAVRPGHAMRAGGELGEVSRGRSRLPRLRAGCHDPWWLRLRQGVSRRALLPGVADPAHRAGQPRADFEFHRREGAGLAEVVLMMRDMIVRDEPHARCAPLPLAGRGWGWGSTYDEPSRGTPLPDPPPQGGREHWQ